jgi:nitroreductase
MAWLEHQGSRSLPSPYRLTGQFNSEFAAVGAGVARHHRDAPTAGVRFGLRRNVHMLEKGLTMRPRRTTFAAGYITDTVDGFRRYLDAARTIDIDEAAWVLDVLDEYFAATAESDHRIVLAARDSWRPLRRRALEQFPQLHAAARSFSGPAPAELVPHHRIRIEDLQELAGDRRSVRWFLDEKVDRDKVVAALRVGTEAPTACNRQPYRIVIADHPSDVARLVSLPMGTKGYLHQVPALAVLVGDLSAFASERDRHLIYIDSCLAAMGFILGLEAQGIASCCINWPDLPDRHARMTAELGLQPYERVVMLIAYGYPDPRGLAPHSARRAWDDVVQFL